MGKTKQMNVDNLLISVIEISDGDYINLTDMTAGQEEGSRIIEKWLTNKNTIEFLGIWEELNNPNFNSPEFRGIRSEAGTNRFYMSVKKWVSKTNSIGIIAKTGRYGGTYAHKDIAFNFGLYISPLFNLLLIKEFQRLKEIESNQYNLEWNVKRLLSKTNYVIQTSAIQKHIIPKSNYSETKKRILYAEEADILNFVLFGCTSQQWKESNPDRALKGENIRDMASINELVILANIESLNATLIKNNVNRKNRVKILLETVAEQREILDKIDYIKSIKKLSGSTFTEEQKKLSK